MAGKQIDAGNVVFRIKSDSSGAIKGIEELQQKGGGGLRQFFSGLKDGMISQIATGNLLSNTFTRMIGWIKNGVTAAIDYATKLQSANSKFGSVFQGVEKEAGRMRDTLITAYSIPRIEATQMLADTQSILTSIGYTTAGAAGLSGELVKLSKDFESFHGVTAESALGDLRSAMTGNTDSLKKYGIVINETILKEEARRRGLLKNLQAGDAVTKSQLTYELILRNSGKALGDYARSSGSAANQIKIFQQNISNGWQKVGERFLPAITPMLKGLNNILDSEGALQRITTQLITLQDDYRKTIDRLKGSQEKLTTAERENLEVRKSQYQLQQMEALKQLNAQYDELYNKWNLKNVLNGQGGTLEQQTQRLQLLQKEFDLVTQAVHGSRDAIDELVRLGANRTYRPVTLLEKNNPAYWIGRQNEILRSKTLLDSQLKAKSGGMDDLIRKYAQMYKDGTITEDMLSFLQEPLRKKLIEMARTLPAQTKKPMEDSGRNTGNNFNTGIKDALSALERIELRVKLHIIQPEKEIEELRDAMDKLTNGPEYTGGVSALTSGGEPTDVQKKALDEVLAIEARIKEIEDERKKIQEELTAAVEDSKQRLAELDRQSQNLIGDELKKQLSGAMAAAVELGDALQKAFSPEMDETKKKIAELRGEIATLKALQLTGSTTVGGENIGDLITSKTAQVDKLQTDANEAGAAVVNAFVAVAQEVAAMVENFVAAYQQTMDELDDAVMDTADKTRMAAEEGFEGVLTGLASQIPIVGNLLSQLVDSLWETEAEKREKALKDLADTMDDYEHRIATGLQQSTADQLVFYENYLHQQQAIGANEEDIEATEERIAALKKEQLETAKEQAKWSAENAKSRAGLLDDTTKQTSYWENLKTDSQSKLDALTGPTYTADQQAEIGQIDYYQGGVDYFQKKINKAISWLTPESDYKAWYEGLAKYQKLLDDAKSIQTTTEAQYQADVEKYTELVKEADLQLNLIKRDQLDYQTAEFEHNLAMSDATEEEKNAARIKYYEDYIKQAEALNTDLNAEIAETQAEMDAEEAKDNEGLSAEQKAAIKDNVDALQAELDALADARVATTDIWEVEEKLKELRKDSLDIMKEQYGVMSDMGLLDLENYDQVERIAADMLASGMSPSDTAAALKSQGVSNATLAESGIGTYVENLNLQTTLNGASSNTLASYQAKMIVNALLRS